MSISVGLSMRWLALEMFTMTICNWLVAISGQLRGKRCRALNSDAKVRVRLSTHTRFYYPDGMVVCQPNPPSDSFQDHPVVITEVLSDTTRRTDEGEKKDAYLTIPTLTAYMVVETDHPRRRRASPRLRRHSPPSCTKGWIPRSRSRTSAARCDWLNCMSAWISRQPSPRAEPS